VTIIGPTNFGKIVPSTARALPTSGFDLAAGHASGAAVVGRASPNQRDANLNTHSVVPPGGLMISGVKLDEPDVGPPPPATTATY